MDVAYSAEGARAHVDVTIRHPCAAKYLTQAAVADGEAARVAEAAKRVRYPPLAEAGLQAVEPFAVETFGRLGASALRFLHAARQRAVERDGLLRGWAGVAMFQRWLGLLSCSLQASLFEAVQAMRGDVGALPAVMPCECPAVLAALPFASPAGQ